MAQTSVDTKSYGHDIVGIRWVRWQVFMMVWNMSPHLYPMRLAKCRQASSRWVWKLACLAMPPHSGQTWGARCLWILWWADTAQELGSIMGGEHCVHVWNRRGKKGKSNKNQTRPTLCHSRKRGNTDSPSWENLWSAGSGWPAQLCQRIAFGTLDIWSCCTAAPRPSCKAGASAPGGPEVHVGPVEAEPPTEPKHPSSGWSWRRRRSPRSWWRERRLEERRTKGRAGLVSHRWKSEETNGKRDGRWVTRRMIGVRVCLMNIFLLFFNLIDFEINNRTWCTAVMTSQSTAFVFHK